LADGGDCLADLGALRHQADLFGAVASSATAWRAIERARGRLDDVRTARAAARQAAWAHAAPREIVRELSEQVALAAQWPDSTRLICRRERPHPGAQLSFTDHDGHRFQCFITDQAGTDIAELEARHRAHARVEDRIRAARSCGLSNLPFRDFGPNEVWLELCLMAQDLLAHAGGLCLDGELRRSEPKRLRQRLLHVAGRITRSGRRVTLHLPRRWPWAAAILRAFERLRALPVPG
jgi:hypothetical protein